MGGFRGMGEGGTIGAPAAIANALADALAPLGAEIFELPMTSERLFRLIEMVKARVQRQPDADAALTSLRPSALSKARQLQLRPLTRLSSCRKV